LPNNDEDAIEQNAATGLCYVCFLKYEKSSKEFYKNPKPKGGAR